MERLNAAAWHLFSRIEQSGKIDAYLSLLWFAQELWWELSHCWGLREMEV